MRPAGDVTFVLIWNSDGEPVQLNTSGFREMKNVFVAVVDESLRTNRLEMTIRTNFSFAILDGNRFDPMDRVLQHEQTTQLYGNLVRQHRVRWRGADVEKK